MPVPSLSQSLRAWQYAGGHRRHLCVGAVAAAGVVAFRLALPWPLKAAIDPLLGSAPADAGGSTAMSSNLWTLGAIFLAIVLALGLFDLWARLRFAKFAIGSVRNLRAAAYTAAISTSGGMVKQSGELVARLIGDTARIKAGLKGFLTHVGTNGLLFIGLAAVLWWTYPPLGMVMAVAALLLLVMVAVAAQRMYDRARRYRTKEGKLAERIHRASVAGPGMASFNRVNASSGRHEAALTRIQGITTWCAHGVFGLAVIAIIALAWRGVQAGAIESGVLVVVAMYAIMMRTPTVQLARQGARSGKILACLVRQMEMIDEAEARRRGAEEVSKGFAREMELRGVRLRVPKSLGRRRVVGPIDMVVRAGERIAVVGGPSSGKTSLLRILAGRETRYRGEILWDGRVVPRDALPIRAAEAIAYASEVVAWPRCRLRKFLGIGAVTTEQRAWQVLRLLGIAKLVERMPDRFDTFIDPTHLSEFERSTFATARAVLQERPVIVIDAPTRRMSGKRAARRIEAVVKAAPDACIIMSFDRAVDSQVFDRVVEVKRGRLIHHASAEQRGLVNGAGQELAIAKESEA